jgi:hypothetical protein
MTSPIPAIVHIGYHKTATTWFQRCFYPVVENYRYIPSGRFRNILICPHAFAFDSQLVRACLDPDHDLPPLLCEEELSGGFLTGGHMGALSKELAERIQRVVPQAQIVVFIRHQVDIIAAAYTQYVRQGGTYAPKRFLFPARYYKGSWRLPYQMPLFAFEHFAYLGLIRHYRTLFGAERVHVFAYEALRQDPSGFLADYAHRLNLQVDWRRVDFNSVYPSYRHRTMRLARILNHLSYRNVAYKQYFFSLMRYKYLRRTIDWFDTTPMAGHKLAAPDLLGREIVAHIEHFYADSNRILAAETGLPLAAYHYPGLATACVEQPAKDIPGKVGGP